MAGAVYARRRYQGGEVVDPFQRSQEPRATAAGAPLRRIVEQARGIEFAQSFQGERRPGAIARQALTQNSLQEKVKAQWNGPRLQRAG